MVALAIAAMPSSRPVNPSRSLVVALTATREALQILIQQRIQPPLEATLLRDANRKLCVPSRLTDIPIHQQFSVHGWLSAPRHHAVIARQFLFLGYGLRDWNLETSTVAVE